LGQINQITQIATGLTESSDYFSLWAGKFNKNSFNSHNNNNLMNLFKTDRIIYFIKMSTLCQKAENLLIEKNIKLSDQKRAVLATYDDDTQVRWIVNPLIEFLLQQVTNQILAGPQKAEPTVSQKTPPVNKKVTKPVSPKPVVQPETPIKVIEPVIDEEDEPIGMGLFDF